MLLMMMPRMLMSQGVRRLSMFTEAKLISGKEMSSKVMTSLQNRLDDFRMKTSSNLQPGLAIVQVGERADSEVYIRMKLRMAEKLGIRTKHIQMERSTSEERLVHEIEKLNEDPSIHGIIVQLPLDTENAKCSISDQINVDPFVVTDCVCPSKDVDGLTACNAGLLASGALEQCFVPCTPQGCLTLIQSTGINIEGARAVVIGRSKIVGSPMAELLKWHNATVTICHSHTTDLESIVAEADILVVAIGKREFIKGQWMKKGAIVIDCGINVVDNQNGRRVFGDVDFDSAKHRASFITPVPGGVGPMTVIYLMHNTIEAAIKSFKKSHQLL